MKGLLKELANEALHIKRRATKLTLTFSQTYSPKDLEKALRSPKDILLENSSARVFKTEELVVKASNKGFLTDFRALHWPRKKHIKSNAGLLGEALNTLVANRSNYPCHQLHGLAANLCTGEVSLFFKALTTQPLTAFCQKDAVINWNKPLDFMRESLSYGIYHIDPHFGNQFYDDHLENGRWIDLEGALPLGLETPLALALQCSGLNKKGQYLPTNEFAELVCSYLSSNFKFPDPAIKLFYARHLKSFDKKGRKQKRHMACGDKGFKLTV